MFSLGRRRAPWLWVCGALGVLACKPSLPDGVFTCAAEGDCPAGFSCLDGLCRRGSKPSADTQSDAALPDVRGEDAAAAGGQGAAPVGGKSSRSDSAAGRGTMDAGSGKEVPPPPPPPFMPHSFVQLPSGRSITAGGARMRSEHYQVWTSVGQSPGTGYPVRSSPNYRLQGGIVGVLQAEPSP